MYSTVCYNVSRTVLNTVWEQKTDNYTVIEQPWIKSAVAYCTGTGTVRITCRVCAVLQYCVRELHGYGTPGTVP